MAEGVLHHPCRKGRAASTAGSEDNHDIAVPHCRPWRLRWHLGRAHDGKAALGHLGIDQWQGAYPTQQIVRDDIEAGHSYVLEEDGEVVATTVIGFTGEPVYDSIEGAWLTTSDSRDPRYAVLHRVAVAQGHGGKGLGRNLLQSAEPVASARVREPAHRNAPW